MSEAEDVGLRKTDSPQDAITSHFKTLKHPGSGIYSASAINARTPGCLILLCLPRLPITIKYVDPTYMVPLLG